MSSSILPNASLEASAPTDTSSSNGTDSETRTDDGATNKIRRVDSSSAFVLQDTLKETFHPVPLPVPSGPVQKQLERVGARMSRGIQKKIQRKNTCFDWGAMLLPMLSWLRTYDFRNTLFGDIVAGLTVGIMVIPQSMSYAKLASLPVEYGLYSAFMPVFAYAFFGSSRQLAVGPVALVSLMLSTSLSHFVDPSENEAAYVTLAIQISMMVGFTYIILGALRLGFITIFLSHAVISGFTSGAAIIIGMSQIKYILGVSMKGSKQLHYLIGNIIEVIDQFDWKVFLMGSFFIFLLLIMKHVGKTYAKFSFLRALGPLAVTALAIIVTVVFDLDEKGIPVIGDIPSGLPEISINKWSGIGAGLVSFVDLIPTVLSISIVGFMESIAIAKQLAVKHQYELDSSQELLGLGMANLAGAMFSSYPVTGSFSRTAVNNETGAKSGISALVTASLVGMVLLFLTPLFERMPTSVLGAIVISGVLGLVDLQEGKFLYKVHKLDFLVWLVSFSGTMFAGVESGLVIAVLLSLLLVLYESAYPHLPMIGRLPGTNVYRNIKQYPNATTYDGLVMCRIDAPIYFANTQNIREKLNKYELVAERDAMEAMKDKSDEGEDNKDSPISFDMLNSLTYFTKVHFIVIDMSPVSHIDTSGVHLLEEMHRDYQKRGLQMCLCNPNHYVMEKLFSSGLADKIGTNYIYCNTHDAVKDCLKEIENKSGGNSPGSVTKDEEGPIGLELGSESNTLKQRTPGNANDDHV
eukprot:CAMPEP_0113319574 /NCGR_PEP_ID=MMETSP0010_2-20120614/13716_1 /TAXON_ID=216773 ORGANISM="Corethron hystrix, Strain 308" /NCGR_SAMPLE_ID=MMETSP0010_2 /ASSEMBLY_ACC=CAM_ASM_000155 /LENGTH=747 /DNA_ID=CAMNT_0000177159 /DNA_START=94 /DNA_END=2337 /DNA_ORIENTATION=- /assembly_acc=CAM_ASM_000155